MVNVSEVWSASWLMNVLILTLHGCQCADELELARHDEVSTTYDILSSAQIFFSRHHGPREMNRPRPAPQMGRDDRDVDVCRRLVLLCDRLMGGGWHHRSAAVVVFIAVALTTRRYRTPFSCPPSHCPTIVVVVFLLFVMGRDILTPSAPIRDDQDSITASSA
jgi:hypothetical protein